jgi:hypothetical protein
MTRKDYVEIARAFRDEQESYPFRDTLDRDTGLQINALFDMRDRLADIFEKDNPRFNREKFIQACVLQD